MEARKFEADGKGVQKEVPLNYAVDIGLFAKHPEDVTSGSGHVLLLERRSLKPGRNVLNFVLDKAPEFGGIDPYIKLIDRLPADNIVSAKGEYRQQAQIIPPDRRSEDASQ